MLLILASVAINLTIGSNGIFTRAVNATDKWQDAEVNEKDEMNKVVNFIDDYTKVKSEVEKAKDSRKFFEKDTTIEDDLENEIRIPQDFKVSDDSATKVEDGIVIEDRVGNQFVWIPAKTGVGTTIHTTLEDQTIVYKRTDFGNNEGSYNSYSETLSTEEETSVNVNGGYYIGRFEAGDKVSTDAGKMRADGYSQTNEISIKKGQAPYNYITYENSKTLAEGMGSSRGYTGTTKLTSSYAWDTAINFIKIKTPDYDSNSPQGNYYETNFSYANIGETDKNQTKEKNSSTLVPTGQTTPVSNIYDMGGNLWERTTEYGFTANFPISTRGGSYQNYKSVTPAGSRSSGSASGGAYADSSFRVTLFCSAEQ